MFQSLYELNYRIEQYQQYVPELPAEFKDVLIKIPFASPKLTSRFLLALADQLIKTGNAIKHSQVKLNTIKT